MRFDRVFHLNVSGLPAPPIGNWWYYDPEHGQHIAFFTRTALQKLASRFRATKEIRASFEKSGWNLTLKPDELPLELDYAKFLSRSHNAVIRVCNATGNVIETHEHAGEFKKVLGPLSRIRGTARWSE